MKQPILVLGANGFIGREVVQALAATDWARPVRGVRTAPIAANDSFEHRIVDATQVDSLRPALEGVAGVVNCVAGDASNIVLNATALFDSARGLAPAPRIIHLSTMSVYGSAIGLMDESAPLRGDLGPYSEAKVAAERIAASYPRCVIFRPGCVFGPGSEQSRYHCSIQVKGANRETSESSFPAALPAHVPRPPATWRRSTAASVP